MISKELLTQSLQVIYRDLLMNKKNVENKVTKEEIWRFISDLETFSKEEVSKNQKEFRKLEKSIKERHFTCYTDGALVVEYEDPEMKTGKTTRAGSGFVVCSEDKILFENYFAIPNKYHDTDTNSQIAEYQALISCLRVLSIYHEQPEIAEVELFTDSEVLVNQMNQKFRVRESAQRRLKDEATKLTNQFKSVNIQYINREKNQRANDLAKKAVDEKEWSIPVELAALVKDPLD